MAGGADKNLDTLISEVEAKRGSKAILYITGEKQPVQLFATQVALDIVPLFKEILEKHGKQEKITLLLNTGGGNLDTPWPLVNLIREYGGSFEVIVLDKALSAGTLISMGADNIVMSEYSHLSPIDPATNIPDKDGKTPKKLEIEDIIAYVEFVKGKIGISNQLALAEVTKELTREVDPTVLGSANRAHSLIRILAQKLLGLRENKLDKKASKCIIEQLTEKMFSHHHLINRREAREIGFGESIEFSDADIKKISANILKKANEIMQVEKIFDPMSMLPAGQDHVEFTLTRAIIASSNLKYGFNSYFQINKGVAPSGQANINVNHIKGGWEPLK